MLTATQWFDKVCSAGNVIEWNSRRGAAGEPYIATVVIEARTAHDLLPDMPEGATIAYAHCDDADCYAVTATIPA